MINAYFIAHASTKYKEIFLLPHGKYNEIPTS